jgi:hypothetical protein
MTETKQNPRHERHAQAKKKVAKKACCSSNEIVRSEGELIITVRRTGFTLHDDLPYCVWGALYVNSKYNILQPYLTSGITFTTTIDPAGDVIFHYTDGKTTDTITISTGGQTLVSYAEEVTNLNTNFMRSNYMLFSVNTDIGAALLANSDIDTMLNAGLTIQQIDGMGAVNKNLIVPRSRRMINNSIYNLVEIYLPKPTQPIKQTTAWVQKFPYIASVSEQSFLTSAYIIFINKRFTINRKRPVIA